MLSDRFDGRAFDANIARGRSTSNSLGNRPRHRKGSRLMDNERNIRRTTLPNGLTILTEKMDHIRSVAMGVWIRAGSRHELAEVNGISHFVEHMVFKGTKSRSAQHIAREVDAIGGNLDAFTGKETVCFNIKVLDEHVPPALDVLSDLVLNPVFANEDKIGRA